MLYRIYIKIIVATMTTGFMTVGQSQSLDVENATYFLATGTTLTSSGQSLTDFNFSSASATHPLFNDGVYYPVNDYLGQNIWVRIRHTRADPNGSNTGFDITTTSGSPFRSGGFGGWGGFLYQLDIYKDVNLTGEKGYVLNGSFKTTILVESIETLSDTEWVLFKILDDVKGAWVLNSINFTGINPGSNPGFSGSNIPYNDPGFSSSFPDASNTIAVIDLPGGGYSEFSMSANSVSSFLYGYEYSNAGGYQGMRLSFGTAPLLPTLISFTPGSGPGGTTVTITGTNFDPVPINNSVKFNGALATVISSTTTSITAFVPGNATTGTITVTVWGNTATSENDFVIVHNPDNKPPTITAATTTIPVEGKAVFTLADLITDADNNLDPSSFVMVQAPVSGAQASITAEGVLLINYAGISFSGRDRLSIQACDYDASCTQQEITVEVVGDIMVYNAVSPNGDNKNDFLFLQYIDAFESTKENQVSIFNRWGDLVFEVDDYNNADRVFKGLNTNGAELTTGTYYYKIKFASGLVSKTGFLYLKH